MRPKGSGEGLAARRRRALALLDEGESLNEVARRIGMSGQFGDVSRQPAAL